MLSVSYPEIKCPVLLIQELENRSKTHVETKNLFRQLMKSILVDESEWTTASQIIEKHPKLMGACQGITKFLGLLVHEHIFLVKLWSSTQFYFNLAFIYKLRSDCDKSLFWGVLAQVCAEVNAAIRKRKENAADKNKIDSEPTSSRYPDSHFQVSMMTTSTSNTLLSLDLDKSIINGFIKTQNIFNKHISDSDSENDLL